LCVSKPVSFQVSDQPPSIEHMPTPEEITRHHGAQPPAGRSAWVAGARPRTGIEVVEPDPAWPWAFGQLADRIREALGEAALAVEHVGSTAVPGLPAKPIIDIDLTVADSADEATWLPPLEEAGFELRIREPWWHEHRALHLDEPPANLHVFGPDSPELVRHRIFRDWLIEHPEDRDRYRDAKVGAAAEANAAGEHVMDYNARKEPVIREIYDRAFRAAGLLD
jgi:GrpB-like predicted nucleotidyltransferase (UPF0157 family)